MADNGLEIIRMEAENRNNIRDRQLKQQEMYSNALYKLHQIGIYKEQNRINAQTADTEQEKAKYDRLAKTAAFVESAYKLGTKYATTEDGKGIDPNKYKQFMQNFARTSMAGNPEVFDILNNLSTMSPKAPEASDIKDLAEAKFKEANAKRVATMGTEPGGGGELVKTSVGPSGVTDDIVYPDAAARAKAVEARGEAAEKGREAATSINANIAGIESAGAELPKAEGLLETKANEIRLAYNKASKTQMGADIEQALSFGASLVQDLARLKQGGARLSDQDIAMMWSFIPYYGGKEKDGALKVGSESTITYNRKIQVMKALAEAMQIPDPIAAGEKVKEVLAASRSFSVPEKSLTTGATRKYKASFVED